MMKNRSKKGGDLALTDMTRTEVLVSRSRDRVELPHFFAFTDATNLSASYLIRTSTAQMKV